MWQTAIALLIVAGVFAYLIRYFSRAYRSGSSVCSSCAADCSRRGTDATMSGKACSEAFRGQGSEDGRFD